MNGHCTRTHDGVSMAEKPRLRLAIWGFVAFFNVSTVSTIAGEPLPAGRASDGNVVAASTTERNLPAREHLRNGLAGIDVVRINDRLSKGRLVEVLPPLTEEGAVLPLGLGEYGLEDATAVGLKRRVKALVSDQVIEAVYVRCEVRRNGRVCLVNIRFCDFKELRGRNVAGPRERESVVLNAEPV